MKTKVLIAFSMLCMFVLSSTAQMLPQEGKFYTISMKTNSEQYMVEYADGSVGVTDYDVKQRIFWEFVPTQNANCFYMRNATTKRYVMSCAGAQKDRIYTTDTPVEYYVAGSGGYVRFTSTDCANYNVTSNSPNGLNKDGASSNVIVWAAGSSNNNSWWKLNATEYLYDQGTGTQKPHTDFMRKAQIYDNPCATTSDIYIKSIIAEGDADTDTFYFPGEGRTAAKPSNGFQLFTKGRVQMRQGCQNYNFEVRLSKDPLEGDSLYIYFDFDRDGVFEECLRPDMQRIVQAQVNIPDDAKLGQSRIRFRLTNNALPHGDDEVCGHLVDVIANVYYSETIGIETTKVEDGISITADGRTLRASSPLGIAQIEVFSMQGTRVAHTTSDHLSLGTLPSGAYVVRARTAKHGHCCTAKLFTK